MKLAFLLAAAVISVTVSAWWISTQVRPAASEEVDHYVTVEEGMSAGRVAKILEEEAIIRNGSVFYLYARIRNLSHNIQAGFYRLSPTQSMAEILDTLTEGRVEHEAVRIPGGADLREISEALQAAGFDLDDIEAALKKDYDVAIFEHKPRNHSLEGYLYPDTYYVGTNAKAADLIEMALVNTDQKLTAELRDKWREHGLSVHEALTLASIVQKEAADYNEQRQAAQVFLTRLEIGQRLESDPTFMYAARQQNVSASVSINSPYNTYRVAGLPPGPIANSEEGALLAVADPADTDYLYFVTGTDGVTRFSKTQEQHEAYIREHGVSGT